jgi:UDP:flavonoid glycosyltransferase YjiC (YdhE family)
MATALFAWELGAGLGHIAQFFPLADALSGRGHRVFAALRDLSKAPTLFARSGATVLQAPYKPPLPRGPVDTPRTYAHVLWNAGFGDPSELQTLTQAWATLLDLINPDLVVFDHSPTALLAARGRPVRRVLLGNGFSCPPECRSFPDLRRWLPQEPERLHKDEQFVLDNVNSVLRLRRQQSLHCLAQLFQEVDEVFLSTFPEFDHYPVRNGVRYRGPWSIPGGGQPIWPEGRGKRIYAYLAPFPNLAKVLNLLRASGCPTIISSGGIDPELPRRFAAPNVHFEPKRLDLDRVAAECDLAVLNGNHATTLRMLLAGKPALQLPIFLEQGLNAIATVQLGAGLSPFPRSPEPVPLQFRSLLESERYAESARRFAVRHADFDPQRQVAAMLDRIDELLR